ncbi:hypothetical protein L798_12132 [Zootermopsis nevadensis]|uniref:Uncharacterized protein n=1 Tax=Zootermopsis nevadensis TaxID=136037 RepID=A0A067R3M9_ZOONE|nr:hypothetical protein L798_12132 [Zootermopsis nevadensis]
MMGIYNKKRADQTSRNNAIKPFIIRRFFASFTGIKNNLLILLSRIVYIPSSSKCRRIGKNSTSTRFFPKFLNIRERLCTTNSVRQNIDAQLSENKSTRYEPRNTLIVSLNT